MTTDPMLLPTTVRSQTVPEREQAGRDARRRRPRTALAQYVPAPDRADPVAVLTAQETDRVQLLLPLRHSRMSVSAFTFYRGAAAVMAADLGAMPNSGLVAQLCGDAHLANFGLFAAPDRSLVFDVNDFDETNPGPFEWDVYRLAASIVLAGRDVGLAASAISDAATAVGRAYRTQMAEYAAETDLAVWYERTDVARMLQWADQDGRSPAAKQIRKGASRAQSRDAWSAIAKLTEVVDGRRRFLDQPPVLMPMPMDEQAAEQVGLLLQHYKDTLPRDRQQLLRRYHVVDVAHKVVGVGSVGLLAFVLLMQGRDENDLLVLQAKQAVRSALEPFTAPSAFALSGERAVVGQQLMQAASDVFLGWLRDETGRDFYVRQLRDMKYAPDPTKFTAVGLRDYALVCGRTLARAHARSGDAVAINAYLGTGAKFDGAICAFALSYAEQVQKDFATYTAAIAAGTVPLEDDALATHYSVAFDPASGLRLVDDDSAGSAGSAGSAADSASGTSAKS